MRPLPHILPACAFTIHVCAKVHWTPASKVDTLLLLASPTMRAMPKSPIFISWPCPTKMLLRQGERLRRQSDLNATDVLAGMLAGRLSGWLNGGHASAAMLAGGKHLRRLEIAVQDVAGVQVVHAARDAAAAQAAGTPLACTGSALVPADALHSSPGCCTARLRCATARCREPRCTSAPCLRMSGSNFWGSHGLRAV